MKKAKSISLRGTTFDKLKIAAAQRGIGASELAQQWLAESPALQLSPIEEYNLLQRLITKRREADQPCNDLILRMREVWIELDDVSNLDPPPKLAPVPKPKPAAAPVRHLSPKDLQEPATPKPVKARKNNQPIFEKAEVSDNPLRGSGYNEL